MKDKLNRLAERIETETVDRLKASGYACIANLDNHRTSVKEGKKYTKIDIGGSGKYMVDTDGNIFGIKAYGVIHRGHQYGTLDTIDDYYWGEYTAIRVVNAVKGV